MNKTRDIIIKMPGLTLIHQKIQGYVVGRHEHGDHEFFMPLQGEISITANETTIKAGPGRMLYVPPDLDHSFSSIAKGSGERLIWLVDQKSWKKQITTQFQPCVMPINTLAKELLFYLLIHPKSEGQHFFISALIETLGDSLRSTQFHQMNRSLDHISGKIDDPRIIKALSVIDENLNSLQLSEVAQKSGLSARNFNRLFLKNVGLTPKDYLILQRVEIAKQLLKKTKLTVTDISLEVGYNSLSKFIGTFKKVTGILPSDFR